MLEKQPCCKLQLRLCGRSNQPQSHKIKYGSVRLFIPTVRASLQDVTVGNVKFKAWDLGGHKQVRGAWRDYFAEADAIIFVVDAAKPRTIRRSTRGY